MTKPITAIAAMQLYERGAFHMSDPITKWLPELKALTVLTEDGERVPVNRPPTMQELLTHTAGFFTDLILETLWIKRIGKPVFGRRKI